MKLIANNNKVHKFFNNFDKISKKHGIEFAKRLQKRLSELEAVQNIKELFELKLGNPHFLKGQFDSCISISITGNFRLLLETGINQKNRNVQEVEMLEEIEIKGVVDYHGNKNEWIIP